MGVKRVWSQLKRARRVKASAPRAFSVTVLVLAAAVIADLFIFRFVTFRPLGLEPSDLAEGPRLHTWFEAAAVN
ncbi:MAG: hypothetical protein ACOX37_05965 [Bacillota bacterium]